MAPETWLIFDTMTAQLIHDWELFWCGGLQQQHNCTGVAHSNRSCIAQSLQHGYKEWRQERSLIHRCRYILHVLILLFSFWSVINSNFLICMEHTLNLGIPFGYMEKELLPTLHFLSFYWSSLTHQGNSNGALPSKKPNSRGLTVFSKSKNLDIFAGQLYFSIFKKKHFMALTHNLLHLCSCMLH